MDCIELDWIGLDWNASAGYTRIGLNWTALDRVGWIALGWLRLDWLGWVVGGRVMYIRTNVICIIYTYAYSTHGRVYFARW